MEKNTKIVLGLAIGIVLITLFTILGLRIFNPSTLSTISGSCYGGVDILISTASHSPGDTFFKGRAIANQAGECFKILWTKEDVEKELASGGTADRGVNGDILINSQSNNFRTILLTGDLNLVEDFNMKQISTYSCSHTNCRTALENQGINFERIIDSNKGGITSCLCIYTTKKGQFGKFQGEAEVNFEAEIFIDGLGSKTITPQTRTANFGNQATFSWSGNLIGTRQLSAPSGFNVFLEGNRYLLTDISASGLKSTLVYVDTFQDPPKNYRLDSIDSCIDSQIHWADVEECIDKYEDKINSLLVNRISEYERSSSIIRSANWVHEQGDLFVDLEPHSTFFPQFSFDIRAEWLGVKYVYGEPKVNCPSDLEGNTGDLENVEFEIKNIADERGAFTLSLDCGDLTESLSRTSVLLDAGESIIITGKVKGVSSTKEITGCEFKAFATKDSNEKDSCSFDFTTIPVEACVPGKLKCSDDKQFVLECNSEGTAFEKKIECELGCEGAGKCIEGGDDEEVGGWFSNLFGSIGDFFKDLFSGGLSIFKWIKFITIAIISLITLFVTFSFLEFNKFLEENKPIRWIISFVITILITLFLIIFIGSFWFWILVIAIILYLIFAKPIVNLITGRM